MKIDGFLTEESLRTVLEDCFSPKFQIKIQYKIPNTRFRCDYAVCKSDGTPVMFVEYDGHHHYAVRQYVSDRRKNKEIKNQFNVPIVRWPYWIQPTEEVCNFLLKLESFDLQAPEDFNDYPHGFISPKCVLPAEFSTVGVRRFWSEMSKFSKKNVTT